MASISSSTFELRLPVFNFEKETDNVAIGFLNEQSASNILATPHSHAASGYTGQGTPHCAPEKADKSEPETRIHGSGLRSPLLASPSLTSTSASSSDREPYAGASSPYLPQPQYLSSPPAIQRKPLPTTASTPPAKTYIPYSPPSSSTNQATTPPPIPEDAFPDRDSPVQLIISSAPASPVQENNKDFSRFEPTWLQKASTMPVTKPPPVPVTAPPPIPGSEPGSQLSTPPRIALPPNGAPVVAATQAASNAVERDQQERSQTRSPSPDHPPPSAAKLQPNRLQPRHLPSSPRGRSVSAQTQHLRAVSADGFRAVSNPLEMRAPATNSGESSPTAMHDKKGAKKRRSWLPGSGSRSRSNSVEMNHMKGTGAWIMCPDAQVDYSVTPLVNGEKVSLFVSTIKLVCIVTYPPCAL